MKGATVKTTMEKPGIIASFSRPRVSNDNPFSEALFQTCKYRPDWPTKGFATRADAQAWVKSFASWYNAEHLHSAIRFVTPSARHAGNDPATLANRASLQAVPVSKPRQSLCKCTRAKPATLVRQYPQPATRRTGLAQPRK
jgi:putative transposase